MATQPIVMSLMASSIKIADSAGQIIREIMEGGDLGTIEKGIDDPQTEADRRSQRLIVASLARLFPKVKVIGEEGQSDLNVPDDWLITAKDEAFLALACPEALKEAKEDEIVVWVSGDDAQCDCLPHTY